jgi:NAD(P)-dependent dehydrogenase (short-subunit alcohol dehydrogenase family)
VDLKIAGRRALVIGSTSGIGYAIAEGLAREGAQVLLNGRQADSLERAIARIKKAVKGAKVVGVVADAATAEGSKTIVGQAPDVDILVNNLGIYKRQGFFETPDEDWMHFYEVNVLSGIRFARAYGQGMRERGWGRIIFISSESGLLIPVDMTNYGVTKTAQIAVMRGLAREFGGCGVTVNCVLPGPTRTEGISTMLADESKKTGLSLAELEKDFFTNARPTSLIQRLSEPEEIANMVVYACSDGASSTTGASLRVEGGIVTGLG